MVNFIGRLFVVLTFAFSMFFLAISIGVYATHVNWKNASRDNPGVIDKLDTKIKELAYARDRSMERYKVAYNQLNQSELERVERQRFQAAKFALIKTGKDERGQPVAAPVFPLEFDSSQPPMLVLRMMPQDASTAIQVRGQPLKSQEAFLTALNARHQATLDEQAKIAQLQQQLADLSTAMQGNGPEAPGLIAMKELMVDARRRAMSEQESLKPALANRFAEATLWLEREQALRRRLTQLGGGQASNKD